jgi:Tfp pilus assembly protein PilX
MRRLRGERGQSIITAVVLMGVMMAMGLAAFAFVDGEQRQSADLRKRDTAFNVAEAALNAQIFSLSQDWAGKGLAGNPYPVCTPAVTSSRCPTTATLQGLFASPDAARGMTWTTSVRDNVNPNTNFYSDAVTASAPAYDANGDGNVWVRSQATVNGKTRILVALVRREEQTEDLPHAAIITGRLDISNNGNKVIIDASAGATVSGSVAVRCTPTLLESSPCLGHELGGGLLVTALASLNDLLNVQLSPNIAVTGYVNTPTMPVDAINRMRKRAQADGTYWASCPPALPTGFAFIESGDCMYTSNDVVNSTVDPGFILMANGSLTLRGTLEYTGVIYNANLLGATGNAVDLGGDVTVRGGILIDGMATLVAGSSKVNLVLDLSAYNAVKSYGSAGIIQNTFRELPSP